MTDINIITTTEFAQMAPEISTSQYTDATVSGFISSASKMVSDYLEYSPYAEDIVEELKSGMVTTEGDLIIYPNKIPVISVSAIKLAKGSSSGDVSLTLTESGNAKYNIDYTKRTIRFPYGELTLQGTPVFTNFFNLRGVQFFTKLSYRGGFEVSELPQTIKLATVLFTRDILSRSTNTSGAKRISQGGISLEYSERDGKSDLVVDAERLLRPYRRIG